MTRIATYGCVLGCAASAVLAVEIRLVPVAGTGNVSIDTTNPLDTQVFMDPGETVRLDVVLADWSWLDDQLRAYQVEVPASSLTSGQGGSLFLQDLDTDDDGACDFAAPLCPRCGPQPDLDGVFVDECLRRCNNVNGAPCNQMDPNACPGAGGITACLLGFPEFVGSIPPLSSLNSTAVDHPAWLNLAWTSHLPQGALDDGWPHYAGSLVLTADSAARGSFELTQCSSFDAGCFFGGSYVRFASSCDFACQGSILGQVRLTIRAGACCVGQSCMEAVTLPECTASGGVFRGHESSCSPAFCACPSDSDCDDGILCTRDYCDTAACVSQSVTRYADVTGDQFVGADDALCLLDTFAGITNSGACEDDSLPGPQQVHFRKKDIAPCPASGDPNTMGDGFVNLTDLLAIWDTFSGDPTSPTGACVTACLGP